MPIEGVMAHQSHPLALVAVQIILFPNDSYRQYKVAARAKNFDTCCFYLSNHKQT